MHRALVVSSLLLIVCFGAGAGSAQESAATDKLRFADGLYEQGLFELAIREYREFESEFPGHSEISGVRLRLGDSLLQEKQFDGAIEVLSRLLKRDPDFEGRLDALYRLGRALIELGRFQDAIRILAEGAKIAPSSEQDRSVSQLVRYWLGEAYSRSNQPEKALEVLDALLRGKVDSDLVRHVRYTAAWSAYQSGKPSVAVGHFREVLGAEGSDDTKAECHFMVGECLFALKKYSEALAEYSKSIEIGGPYEDDASFARGWCLFESGQYSRAGEAFLAVAEGFSESSFAPKAWLRSGISFFQANRDQEAHRVLLKAANEKDLAVGPEAHYWLSMVFLRQDKVDSAIQFLSRVRTSDEKLQVRVAVALGEALYRQERYKEAVRAFSRLVSSLQAMDKEAVAEILADEQGSYAYAVHATGLSHQAMQQAEESIAAEDLLLELFPKSEYVPAALLIRGESLYALERYEESAATLEKLVQDFPRDVHVAAGLYKRGWSFFELKQFSDARRCFVRLNSRFPKSEYSEESAKLAGQCLARLGKTENAISELEKVTRIDGEVGDHALLEVARLKREKKDLAGAVQSYANLATKTKDRSLKARAHYEQAEVLYQGEAFANASKAYEAAFEEAEDPKLKRAALYGLAWSNYRAGSYDQAVERASTLIEADGIEPPLRASTLHLRGASHQKKGEWEPAIGSFRTLLTDHSGSELAYEAAFGLGVCLAGSGQSKKAITMLSQVLKRHPEGPANDRVLYELAFACKADQKDLAMASAFQRLLKDYPKSPLAPEVQFRLGEVHYQQGDLDKAVASYGSVLDHKESPFRDKALYKKAWAERQADRFEEAAASFLQLTEECRKSPLRGEAFYLAGDCLRKVDRPKDAEKAYRALLASYPKHDLVEKAHLDLGLSQVEAQAWNEAVATLSQHRQRYPESERFFEVDFWLGKSLQSLERFSTATQAFRRVTSSFRGETAARSQFEIGECLRRENNHEGAVSEYLKVRFLYGHAKWVAASMYRCAQCFEQLKQLDRAVKTYTDLSEQYSDCEWAMKAKQRLAKLGEM